MSERKFIDERNPNEIITETQLRSEYLENYPSSEISEDTPSFEQYIENCLQRNNGTLMESK